MKSEFDFTDKFDLKFRRFIHYNVLGIAEGGDF